MNLLAASLPTAASVDSAVADDDLRCVEAARGGDRDAFAELVRRHERQVFRIAGRCFRCREDVEDAAQEAFLRAFSRLGSFRGEAPFEHWLARLTLNLCYERLRSRRPELVELPATLANLATEERDPTARLETARLLARLAPADRFLLTWLDAEGWSVAEAAERLGWSRTNVKVRAFRARRKLRRILEQEARGR